MKVKLKITIDVLMTLLFLVQMGYHMLDNRAHEWTGITLFLLFFLHHILNGGWQGICSSPTWIDRVKAKPA